jgi:hypothetical protein
MNAHQTITPLARPKVRCNPYRDTGLRMRKGRQQEANTTSLTRSTLQLKKRGCLPLVSDGDNSISVPSVYTSCLVCVRRISTSNSAARPDPTLNFSPRKKCRIHAAIWRSVASDRWPQAVDKKLDTVSSNNSRYLTCLLTKSRCIACQTCR